MKWLRLSIFLVAIPLGAVTFIVGSTAQSEPAVSGTTADPAGAVIPNAKLTLTNKATGEVRKTTSDNYGHFKFESVARGTYSLKVEVEGFVTVQMPLTVGTERLTIPIKMEIRITEEVMVNARELQPELPENNADAVEINANMVRGLPLRGDNLVPLLGNFLNPAAIGMKGPSIIVDGVEDGGLDIPSNALRRVVINKNPYAAEYRRPGVARIEVTTIQGSRQVYDGSVALFLRDSNLSARNAFAIQKPDSNLRLLETHFSGPISFIKRERISTRKNVRKFVPSASFFVSGSHLNSNDTAVVNALTPEGPVNQNVPVFKGSTNLLGRVDLMPNRLTRLSLRYNFHDRPERNLGVGGLDLAEQALTTSARVHRFQLHQSTAVSNNFLNTFRFALVRERHREGQRATDPEIKVKGAFTGGPAQTAKAETETRLQFQDIVSYGIGRQTFRFGGFFQPRLIKIVDASNWGGTFTFPNLEDFAAGDPTLFQIVRGDPEVAFSHPEAYAFFQDEIRATANLTLMLGLRYEWQAQLDDHNNFAPRLALAFAPGDKKTVLRLGAGIFYDRLPTSVVARNLLFDGQHLREFVIQNPSFPNALLNGNQLPIAPSVWRLAAGLQAPYLIQASGGVEHRFGTDKQLTLEYQTIRGVHLLRARNINAPTSPGGALPNPEFVLVNQVESSASLRSNALTISVRGGLIRKFRGIVQYTLARTEDSSSGIFKLPANNYDLRPEWGRANLDRRHRFNVAGTWSLPWDLKLGTILSLTSGPPYEITTGEDDNLDRVVNDRPVGIFRNAGRGPGFAQLDFRLSKFIQLPTPFTKDLTPGKRFRNLELNIDVYNVLNRNNLSDIVGETSSPLFGRATSSLEARAFQLSFKYSF